MSDVPVPDPPERAPNQRDALLYRLQPMFTIIIAVVAIGLAMWEGTENRRHNRLSVVPRLGGGIDTGRNPDGEYVRLSVENTGLGPAVITLFRVHFDGEWQDTTVTARTNPWSRVIAAFANVQINAHAVGEEYYFPPGRTDVVFEARRAPSDDTTGIALPEELLPRVAVQICYCSIYETDCGKLLLATAQVTALSCPED
jgi:hypothetical protein